MSLRDFEFFSFFLEILCFFVPHYTRQILQKIDAKRNDHVFPKLNEPSWFLQIFVLENNIFHIFYFLFPDWYIHETIHNLIFKRACKYLNLLWNTFWRQLPDTNSNFLQKIKVGFDKTSYLKLKKNLPRTLHAFHLSRRARWKSSRKHNFLTILARIIQNGNKWILIQF